MDLERWSTLLMAEDGVSGRPATCEFVTPYVSALDELRRRRTDAALRARVEEYLRGDVPHYFAGAPVLYLCRHVASPNFQTLRFLRQKRCPGMRTVIGQDPEDRFVPENQLKHSLGKLSIYAPAQPNHFPRYRNTTIVDFNQSNGKALRAVQTSWGQGLVDFHNEALALLMPDAVCVEHDSDWVDRYGRGALLEEYKRFLALFVVHGLMFEDYPVEDSASEAGFVTDVLAPAFRHVTDVLGYAPLICPLVPFDVAPTRVWEGYPDEILHLITKKMETAA